MIRDGRPLVVEFHGSEYLYLRYSNKHWVNGELDSTAIRGECPSFNRGSMSEPEDVLYSEDNRYQQMGAVWCSAGEIPSPVSKPPAPAAAFKPVHDPLEDNYSHCEIRSKKVDLSAGEGGASAAFRKEFRIRLARIFTQERISIAASDPPSAV